MQYFFLESAGEYLIPCSIDAGDEAAGSLIALKHTYRKEPEKYDELKLHLGAYVGRSKAKQLKQLQRLEVEYQNEEVTVDRFLNKCYEPLKKKKKKGAKASSESSERALEYHSPGRKRPGNASSKAEVDTGNRPLGKIPKRSSTATSSSAYDSESEPTTRPNMRPKESSKNARSNAGERPEGNRDAGTPPLRDFRERASEQDRDQPDDRSSRGPDVGFRGGRPYRQPSWRGRPFRGPGRGRGRNDRAFRLAQVLDFMGY